MDSNIYHRKGPGTGSQAATGETISRLQDGEFETFGMKGLRSKEQTPTEDKNKLQARGFKASNVEVSSTKLMVRAVRTLVGRARRMLEIPRMHMQNRYTDVAVSVGNSAALYGAQPFILCFTYVLWITTTLQPVPRWHHCLRKGTRRATAWMIGPGHFLNMTW